MVVYATSNNYKIICLNMLGQLNFDDYKLWLEQTPSRKGIPHHILFFLPRQSPLFFVKLKGIFNQ